MNQIGYKGQNTSGDTNRFRAGKQKRNDLKMCESEQCTYAHTHKRHMYIIFTTQNRKAAMFRSVHIIGEKIH